MPSVLLLTDRPSFAALWSAACGDLGLRVEVQSPAELERGFERAPAVLFDAESGALRDGALLGRVALARAQGAVTAVALGPDAVEDDLLAELCGGLLARRFEDVARVAAALQRRTAPERATSFAHVGLAPDGKLLALFADGSARLLARPWTSDDPGGEVAQLALSDDARSAQVALRDGTELQLTASALLSVERGAAAGSGAAAPSSPSVAAGLGDVDGVRLGQRLRALRLAAGLTQAELARRTGIHRPNIARVEAGRHTPSLETLARLAAAIGISTTRVLSD